jgi:hypothetical protein
MQSKLTELSNFLKQNNLHKESIKVDTLTKESLMGPTPQRVQEIKSKPINLDAIHFMLDLIGLVPGLGEGADLSNAALYLSEGITPTNLLLAGISVTSMVPGLGDVSKVIKYGSKLTPEVIMRLAQLILSNEGKIRAAFTKLKDPKVVLYLKKLVPNSDLLTFNSDKMMTAIKNWANTASKSAVKSEMISSIKE